MEIVPYSSDRAKEVADLFYQSVHAIDSAVYFLEQKEAWAPRPADYERWRARLEIRQPFLAIMDDKVAGFIELEADGHIDCVYVLPEYQRQGVGKELYRYAELVAVTKGIERLYVEASVPARPFFEVLGFIFVHENSVSMNGQTLVNFTLEKRLA